MSAPDPSPADLLGAASLLLTGLAVLYGVWYSSIEAAQGEDLPRKAADAVGPLARIHKILVGRAYPLALASVLTTLVFASEAITILVRTVSALAHHHLHAFTDYDPIEAAFVLVVIGTGFLAWHVTALSLKLRKKWQAGKELPV